MSSNNLNRPNHGVLGELESVKDTLHAVDGNIKHILSVTAESQIPVLEDVVSSDPSGEYSADDQLSMTNKYKTLSERDLEKAAAEAAAEQANLEPALAATSDDQELMLHLDELLIDDELELGLEADFDLELGLETETGNTDTDPTPQVDGPSGDDGRGKLAPEIACEIDTPEQAIMPDIELLNAELGVEPLPCSSESPASDSESPETIVHGDLAATQAQEIAPPISQGVMNNSSSGDGQANDASVTSLSSNEKLDFGISTSTSFSISSNHLFGAAEPTPDTHAPLEPEELTKLIEIVVEAQIPALKRSLLEHLTPLLCQHPVDREAN